MKLFFVHRTFCFVSARALLVTVLLEPSVIENDLLPAPNIQPIHSVAIFLQDGSIVLEPEILSKQ